MIETPPIGLFDQAAGSFFCFIAALTHGLYAQRLILQTRSKNVSLRNKSSSSVRNIDKTIYPFTEMYAYFYHPVWIIANLCAVLFHARETILTERLDYFSALFALLVTLYTTFIRIFWITSFYAQIVFFIPFLAYFTWHCIQMHFVLFDYGWHMNIGIGLIAIHIAMWLIYLIMTRKPHLREFLIWSLLVGACAQCEIHDFPVQLTYFDAHALWHGCAPLITKFFHVFMIKDAFWLHKHYQND